MAIWDNVDNVDSNSWSGGTTKTVKCPGCGDSLRHEPSISKLACRSCGSIYAPSTLELEGVFSGCSNKVAREEDANKSEYICGTCGATLVCKKETASTVCAYCGSPTIIERRLEHEFAPEFIIPFKVTRTEAFKNLKEFIGNNKRKDKRFGSNIKESDIQGIYVPFWLVSSIINAEYTATNTSGQTFKTNTEFRLQNVPFDGGRNIDNSLMRAIEPFDNSELVPYSDYYLSGFYAERYNESPFEMLDSIEARFERYSNDICVANTAINQDEIDESDIFVYHRSLNSNYGLYPVWFVNFDFDGVRHQFAINGQTGEAAGEIPDGKDYRFKRGLKAGAIHLTAILLTIAIMAVIVGLFIFRGWFFLLPLIFIFGVFSIFFMLSNAIVWNEKVRLMDFDTSEGLDAPPSFENYIDFTYHSSIDRTQKFYNRYVQYAGSGSKRKDTPSKPSVIQTMFKLIFNAGSIIGIVRDAFEDSILFRRH